MLVDQVHFSCARFIPANSQLSIYSEFSHNKCLTFVLQFDTAGTEKQQKTDATQTPPGTKQSPSGPSLSEQGL